MMVEHHPYVSGRCATTTLLAMIGTRELDRLDAMGFIKPKDEVRGLNAIVDDHAGDPDEFDLKKYVEITDDGADYLELRKRLKDGESGSTRR
jgi:hypothetical protein